MDGFENPFYDCEKENTISREELRRIRIAKREMLDRIRIKGKEAGMTEKEFAKGIYIKKFTNQYGDWLFVSIKRADGGYDNYKFYPKKEQKNDNFIDFYGVVDCYNPQAKEG